MRKLTYLLVIVAFGFVSCTPKGYTITGTVEGSTDGDSVYIMERVNRQFVPLDAAVITGGKFTFTGKQDSAVNRYLSYMAEDDLQPSYVDFFIENGNIRIKMVKADNEDVISGTPLNDKYQVFKNTIQAALANQKAVYDAVSAASAEEKQAKMEEAKAAEAEVVSTIKDGIGQNSTTSLGVFLINSYYYYFEYSELGELLDKLPVQYQGNENMVRLKELVEVAKATAVGQKFVDFEMKDLDGNPVKLSDYAGKGKLVLVDFWASWCGPCRREMPKLVEAYAKYKDKRFEIVGVSLDRNEEAWKKGLEQLEMTWPQMSDLKYWDSAGAKLYAVRSIPHVVLIDGEGTIISRGLYGEELHKKLAELLD